MNSSVIGPATVKMSGALELQNAELKSARLTFIGASPAATVKLWRWDGKRFVEYDTVKQATINENLNNGDKMTISGISQLTREQGVGFDESDCMVTWDVTITGTCSDCA